MTEEIYVLVKIADRFYEGTLKPQQIGVYAQTQQSSNKPVFPEIYAEMVTVMDRGSFWQITPKAFLKTEDFVEIARIVKQLGGDYVSAGKFSHFKIPKK